RRTEPRPAPGLQRATHRTRPRSYDAASPDLISSSRGSTPWTSTVPDCWHQSTPNAPGPHRPPGSARKEQLKRAVSPPAVDTEVGVQGENPSGPVVGGHVDKARVGEVHRRIGVLTHELEHGTGVSGEAIGHLEDAAVNVLQDSRGGAFDVPQEVTTLR